MTEEAEKLRRVRGGVIGCFTPVEALVDIEETKQLLEVGDNKLGLVIPKGKFVYGVSIRNVADDLVGEGALLGVKVGEVEEIEGTAVATLKGKGVAKIVEEPLYLEEDAELVLTIAEALPTAGKVELGVIYG